MRLSIDNPADYERRLRATIYLDGVKVPYCILADDEQGVILEHRKDEHGAFIWNDDHTDARAFERHGTVRIELGPVVFCTVRTRTAQGDIRAIDWPVGMAERDDMPVKTERELV